MAHVIKKVDEFEGWKVNLTLRHHEDEERLERVRAILYTSIIRTMDKMEAASQSGVSGAASSREAESD